MTRIMSADTSDYRRKSKQKELHLKYKLLLGLTGLQKCHLRSIICFMEGKFLFCRLASVLGKLLDGRAVQHQHTRRRQLDLCPTYCVRYSRGHYFLSSSEWVALSNSVRCWRYHPWRHLRYQQFTEPTRCRKL